MFVYKESCSSDPSVATRTALQTLTLIYRWREGPELSKVRTLAELSCFRMTVESYVSAKGKLQCKRC